MPRLFRVCSLTDSSLSYWTPQAVIEPTRRSTTPPLLQAHDCVCELRGPWNDRKLDCPYFLRYSMNKVRSPSVWQINSTQALKFSRQHHGEVRRDRGGA